MTDVLLQLFMVAFVGPLALMSAAFAALSMFLRGLDQ